MIDKFQLEFCRQFKVLPDVDGNGKLKVLISNSSDLSILSYVRFASCRELFLQRITETELNEKLEALSGEPGNGHKPVKTVESNTTSGNKTVAEVDRIIYESIRSEASDIHFEPFKRNMVCRARIDGILQNRGNVDRSEISAVLSRIKIMANLDIAEKRRPQDGRIGFSFEGREVDIRVSIIPTEFGEKAVLRILDRQILRLDLGSLGFTDNQLNIFRERISLPNGIILVTGPTGSGKTTTLYAALNELKSSEVNISTVEDPIEYNLEGINQTHINTRIGLTFSSMLRALLRQDPNIIMVGEIRDKETLEIAIRASQTGHLVLSTLHTNSAAATIARLIDMGAEPMLLASSLKMIVAQRLVRKVCKMCNTAHLSEQEIVAARKLNMNTQSDARAGRGCEDCDGSGFKGRTSIYEVLPISKTLVDVVACAGSEVDILRVAKDEGFRTMSDIACDLINKGVTTPLEVLKELNC